MRVINVITSPHFFYEAIRGGRLSYHSEGKMDSLLKFDALGEWDLVLGPSDRKWITDRFRARVQGETKFLRTIPISIMLSASAKFWRELDTYKVGTVRQSDSLMHRLLSRGPFTEAEFDVSEEFRQSPTFKTYFTLLNELWHDWKAEGGRRNDRQSQKWQHMQDFVIASYVYTSQFTLNYEVMRNIYSQRKNHRMASQWRAFFDEVLVRLPFSEIVTEDLPFLGDTSPFGLRSLAAWHTTPRA